ncbi:hypothetical protein NDU88_008704 [Pleurodeles waltl]|uniref:Uncharacterized protein n=1 Tax=Pleurodeles waltl TaxID=8319 RepID=A0AAV7PQ85_PLEWA|nr:hypothetical protein NDU88_008704 [Pleurodeles waltl]
MARFRPEQPVAAGTSMASTYLSAPLARRASRDYGYSNAMDGHTKSTVPYRGTFTAPLDARCDTRQQASSLVNSSMGVAPSGAMLVDTLGSSLVEYEDSLEEGEAHEKDAPAESQVGTWDGRLANPFLSHLLQKEAHGESVMVRRHMATWQASVRVPTLEPGTVAGPEANGVANWVVGHSFIKLA